MQNVSQNKGNRNTNLPKEEKEAKKEHTHTNNRRYVLRLIKCIKQQNFHKEITFCILFLFFLKT